MSGAKSRNKGARGELEICRMLTDNLGVKFSRQLKQYQQAQHGDIEPLAGPFLIEVKNQATLNLKAWWHQAVTAAAKVGAVPCLAYKFGRGQWRFMVPMRAAWESGHQWGRELQFTQTLYPDGFYMLVREHL